jgi:hypothetical protein
MHGVRRTPSLPESAAADYISMQRHNLAQQQLQQWDVVVAERYVARPAH